VGRSSSVVEGSERWLLFGLLGFGGGAWLAGAIVGGFSAEHDAAEADFTLSNSEVVTMYSCFAGRMRAISFWVFSMRSGVGGCEEKTFGMVRDGASHRLGCARRR